MLVDYSRCVKSQCLLPEIVSETNKKNEHKPHEESRESSLCSDKFISVLQATANRCMMASWYHVVL